MAKQQPQSNTANARTLRKNQTKSEGLLWSLLRAKQLCGLKFRRQHSVGPWITDFACPNKMLVVEIDGGYHDQTIEKDMQRQRYLESHGWTVVRFTDDDVEQDTEAVGRSIAKAANVPYEFKKRRATGSGGKSVKAAKPKTETPLPSLTLDPPKGRVKENGTRLSCLKTARQPTTTCAVEGH